MVLVQIIGKFFDGKDQLGVTRPELPETVLVIREDVVMVEVVN